MIVTQQCDTLIQELPITKLITERNVVYDCGHNMVGSEGIFKYKDTECVLQNGLNDFCVQL